MCSKVNKKDLKQMRSLKFKKNELMIGKIDIKSLDDSEIPRDWKMKKLHSLTQKIGSGVTPNGGEKVYKKEGRPFLRSQNIGWGSLLMHDVAFINDEIHNSFKSTEIQTDDVFLNITGASIGRSAVANRFVTGGNVNQHVCIIRTKKEELYPYFLSSFLLSRKGQNLIESYQAGGNRQGLNFEQIKSFKIPLPPLPEQKAIAQLLCLWDDAITKMKALINQKEQRKKWLMQNLLPGKKRLKGFSGEWEENKLKEVFERVIRRNNVANTNVVTISAQRGFVKQTDFFKKSIASELLDNYFLVDKGEFCYNKSYSNGYPWGATKRLNDFDKAVVTTLYICFGIKNKNKTSGDFFEQFFDANLLDKGLMKIAHEGGRAHGLLNVTPGDFFELKITIPNYKEQIAIAAVLNDAGAEIQLLKTKMNKIKEQKKGLMQVLLTGKKRLKINTI